MTDRNASNSQINTYAPESKINAKLHQTYVNNMNYNNTHKMQCMDTKQIKWLSNWKIENVYYSALLKPEIYTLTKSRRGETINCDSRKTAMRKSQWTAR